ncbi:MAG TPA: cation diffusion facilitator family transporter, partial [Steroidobacteraceae bacterium]
HHLMTDVWTSGGVLVGVGLVAVTGWQRLDPIVAIAVALNIVWTGGRIVRDSISGLMDTALPPSDIELIRRLLEPYERSGLQYHALRTRQAGAHRFVSFHVLVPPEWTVQQGHDVLERIEADIRRALPPISVLTHLEPLGDPSAMNDLELHRDDRA